MTGGAELQRNCATAMYAVVLPAGRRPTGDEVVALRCAAAYVVIKRQLAVDRRDCRH